MSLETLLGSRIQSVVSACIGSPRRSGAWCWRVHHGCEWNAAGEVPVPRRRAAPRLEAYGVVAAMHTETQWRHRLCPSALFKQVIEVRVASLRAETMSPAVVHLAALDGDMSSSRRGCENSGGWCDSSSKGNRRDSVESRGLKAWRTVIMGTMDNQRRRQ